MGRQLQNLAFVAACKVASGGGFTASTSRYNTVSAVRNGKGDYTITIQEGLDATDTLPKIYLDNTLVTEGIAKVIQLSDTTFQVLVFSAAKAAQDCGFWFKLERIGVGAGGANQDPDSVAACVLDATGALAAGKASYNVVAVVVNGVGDYTIEIREGVDLLNVLPWALLTNDLVTEGIVKVVAVDDTHFQILVFDAAKAPADCGVWFKLERTGVGTGGVSQDVDAVAACVVDGTTGLPVANSGRYNIVTSVRNAKGDYTVTIQEGVDALNVQPRVFLTDQLGTEGISKCIQLSDTTFNVLTFDQAKAAQDCGFWFKLERSGIG